MDKPAGPTSHDVVRQARRACGTRAAGHTGTLAPFATGLLVVLVGRATRLARFVEQQPKTYLATARLGVVTDTDDATGTVVAERPVPALGDDAVRTAVAELMGRQLQRPPAYSAKKVAGERSHRLAREGRAVALAPVPVEVLAAELVAWHAPELAFRVTVSPGTYVRALARDLGERLGCGAHLVALRRERIGALDVAEALPLDALVPGVPLRPLRAVLGHLPARELSAAEVAHVRHGRPIGAGAEPAGDVLLCAGGEVLAVGRREGGALRPRVVLEGA